MATLADLRDFVREQTLLETDDWSNTKVNVVINEGVLEVATRFDWPWLADIADFSLVADQQAYTFATITNAGVTSKNIGKIEAIIDRDRRVRLIEMDPSRAWERFGGDMPESTDPTHFFIWGESVYLVPVPTTADTDRLRVFYYRKPALLSNDSDSPEWDSQFHYAAAYWAVARAWEREEDFEKASAWRSQFDSRVEAMARYYLNRASDAPIIVGARRRPDSRANLPFLDGVS